MGADAVIGIARFVQYAGACIVCGSPLFCLYALESERVPEHSTHRAKLKVLVLAAAGANLLGAAVWVMALGVSFSDDAPGALNPGTLLTVLTDTRFGRAALLRMALLLLVLVLPILVRDCRWLWRSQFLLGSAVMLSFAWTGHGSTGRGIGGEWHLAFDLAHLLAAGIWIGALAALAVLVLSPRRAPSTQRAGVVLYGLDRFSAIGLWVVGALVVSGIGNSWYLIGRSNWRSLYSTPYGLVLLTKLALFGTMLLLAALNRYRTAIAMRSPLVTPEPVPVAVDRMRSGVVAEMGLAVLVLMSVAALGMLMPPALPG